MYTVLLVIHIMITIALIAIVLVQRTSSDGMLSSSSSTSFMSGRAAASFVTHTTAILGILFILSSLTLGFITAHNRTDSGSSIIDKLNAAPIPNSPTNKDALPLTPQPVPATKEPIKPTVPRPQ